MLRDDAFGLLIAGGRTAVLPIHDRDSSMAPLLRGGDAVAARALGAIRRGDLVVFGQQDYLVVHRYLGRARAAGSPGRLRTRGDGRNRLDPPLDPSRALARVVAVRRSGVWRTLDGAGPAAYGALMAWHALAWSLVGALLAPVGLQGVVGAVERGILAVLVPPVFSALHRRAAEPADERPPKPD